MFALMDAKIAEAKREIEEMDQAATSADSFMRQIVKFLHDRMLKYNWVGFYMLEAGAQPPTLVLGPFEGAVTSHTHIPLNQGICGAAVSGGKTLVVDDVSQDSRYLACSLETQSEIVVPVFAHGKVVGELDIDSHSRAAFGNEDRELLEYCASLLGRQLEKNN